MPHLGAAYNLARWLSRTEQDAEDIVQKACLRAFEAFGGYRGGDGRSWLLRIVRNTAYTWLRRNRASEPSLSFDEEMHALPCEALNPEQIVLRELENCRIKRLPTLSRFRLARSCHGWHAPASGSCSPLGEERLEEQQAEETERGLQ